MFQRVKGNKQQPQPIQAPTPARQQPSQAPAQAPASQAPARQAAQTPAPQAPAQSSPSPSGRNVLSSDVEIKGSIKFSNDLVVDGKIEGDITSDGSLTVGENARINAEIKTQSVVIYGKVYGNIEVSDRVELKANCELVGDIKATSLSIEPGAVFVGKSTVGTPTAKPQTPAAKSSPAAAAQKPATQPVKAQQSISKPLKPKESQPQLPKQPQQSGQAKPSANKPPQSISKP